MSQPRIRKMLNRGAEMPRARTSATKAAGDSMACSIRPQQEILPSRTKNKIPKSVRYDLENALVGLCDVWFEEIKPHLVRNNIKLHVNGSSAGGDHERPPRTQTANSDCVPPPSPLASGCSHLDPGAAPDRLRRTASCVGSSSTPLTASRAPCARLRTLSRRPLSPLLSVPQTPRDCPQIQSLNCEEKKLERRCIHRKRRRFQPQPQPSWRVPRLCRTYTVLNHAGAGAGSRTMMIASHRPPPPRDDYCRFIGPRRESVMKNKTTQTEEALCVSRGCQSRSSKCRPTRCNPKRSPTRSSAPRNPTCNSVTISLDCASSTLIVPPDSICRFRRPEATLAEISPLLQDDLIDIIAESNERRLKLLYSSSEKDNRPSFMNLFPNSQKVKRGLKKLPPWR